MIKPSQSIAFYFGVQNPTTGAAVNADSTPTVVVYKNGAVDVAVTPTVTNPATGSYKVVFTIPSGYAAGDLVEVLATATVSSVTSPPTSVFYDSVDTARESDTYSKVDTEVQSILDAVDTEVTAIKLKTDNLPVDPADASDIAASFATVNATLGTLATTAKLLSYIKSLARKDFAEDADIAGAFDAATDSLEAIADAVAGFSGSSFPAGAIEFTYTVTNSVTSNPIDEVEVWISTDLAGTNIIWSGTTDAFGIARDVNNNKPLLDAGTFYFFRQKSGYSFTNPDTETVS